MLYEKQVDAITEEHSTIVSTGQKLTQSLGCSETAMCMGLRDIAVPMVHWESRRSCSGTWLISINYQEATS